MSSLRSMVSFSGLEAHLSEVRREIRANRRDRACAWVYRVVQRFRDIRLIRKCIDKTSFEAFNSTVRMSLYVELTMTSH
jgi:hypothetical protein